MNIFLLLAQADNPGQVQQIAERFGVDWPHLGAQMISFGIVCVLLHRYAYRPVLAMLEARRQRIAEGLANADKIKAELAGTEEQRRDVLAKAGAQANTLAEEARAAAARLLQQETQNAQAQAQRILADARDAADREHDRMLADLKRELGHLVVQTTAAVAGRILTPEDQKRIAEETAKQVAA
jgi:F-type H+-transporting ATPase subunit b